MAIAPAPLSRFERGTFASGGKERDVYRQGSGPAVIVISEMPGITPKVLGFAERVASLGLTVVLPHLFGVPGADPLAQGKAPMALAALRSMGPACISKEFTVLATGQTSPVIDWLRALARSEHERCGGPGVGAVGMCFTGGFALAMATDERLLAPVLSQPSLPLPVSAKHRATIDISPADLAKVRRRCQEEGLEVVGLRFQGDKVVPGDRFAFLRRELGDAFVGIELDDASAAPSPAPPHSVLTEHLVDEPGQPTREALDLVLDLFRRRLLEAPAG